MHGILQARILEWVANPFPGDLPDPGIKPGPLALQEGSLLPEPPEEPRPFRDPISNLSVYSTPMDTYLTIWIILKRVTQIVWPE